MHQPHAPHIRRKRFTPSILLTPSNSSLAISVAPTYKNVPAVMAITIASTPGSARLCTARPAVTPTIATPLNADSHKAIPDFDIPDFRKATSSASDSAGWCRPMQAAIMKADLRSAAKPSAAASKKECMDMARHRATADWPALASLPFKGLTSCTRTGGVLKLAIAASSSTSASAKATFSTNSMAVKPTRHHSNAPAPAP
mmetsp:Transcript_31898/g.68785  ORF Transcript_31898/g.68785 Transcript_31898/m.68785 type:complete len:200 (+) Transcript_31898:140-739(+)